MSIFNKIFIIIFLSLLANFSVFSQNQAKITSSTIISDLIEKKKQNPKITNQALADYANELLAKKGFNYNFEMSELFNKFSSKQDFPDTMKEYVINFPFEFTLADKRKKTFNLEAKKNLMNQCYDESSPAFPVVRATINQVSVIIDGKPTAVKIPKEFFGTNVQMVDATTKKKVRQNWLTPYSYGFSDDSFVGISADGKKIYLSVEDTYVVSDENLIIKELALEIATEGTLRFVPQNILKKKYKVDYVQNLKIEEAGNILLKVRGGDKIYYFVLPNMSC